MGPKKFGSKFSLPKPAIITPETSPKIQAQGGGYLLSA